MTPVPEQGATLPQWLTAGPLCWNEHLPLEAAPAREWQRLALERAGVDHLHRRFRAGTPCSPTHLAWLVIKGRVRAQSSTRVTHLSAGELFLSPAGAAHYVELLSQRAIGCWFHFHSATSHEPFQALPRSLSPSMVRLIYSTMEQFITEATGNRSHRPELITHLAGVIRVFLQREILVEPANQPFIEHEQRLEQLWEKVRQTPAQPWSVARLAQTAHLSPSYLHKVTMRHSRITPMEKVQQLRIELAKALLLDTSWTLEAIAERIGYSNPYAFSNAFQRTAGERPGAFRRRCQAAAMRHAPK